MQQADGAGASVRCDGDWRICIRRLQRTGRAGASVGVTKIGEYAFAGCNGLTELTVPSGITEIKDYTFAWCTRGLTRLNGTRYLYCLWKKCVLAAMTRLVFHRSGHSEAIAPGGLSDLAGAESSNKGTQNYNTYGRVVTSLPGREWGWDDEPHRICRKET